MCEPRRVLLLFAFVVLLLFAAVLTASPESLAPMQNSPRLDQLLSTLSDEANGLILDLQASKERVLTLESILKDSEKKIADLQTDLGKSLVTIDGLLTKQGKLSADLKASRTEAAELSSLLKQSKQSLDDYQTSLIWKAAIFGSGCIAVGFVVGLLVN